MTKLFRKSPFITLDMCRGSALSVDEIEVLWRFRLSLVSLRTGVDQVADLVAFRDWVSASRFVYRFWKRGRLVGFWTVQVSRETVLGKSFVALSPEYGFFAKHARRHPLLPLTVVATLAYAAARYPLLPLFGFAPLSPVSLLPFMRFPSLKALDDVEDPWERQMVLDMARRRSGWDEQRRLLQLDTIQIRDPEAFEARVGHHEGFRRYAALNPTWAQGHVIMHVIPIRIRDVAGMFGGAFDRLKPQPMMGRSRGRLPKTAKAFATAADR